MTNFVKVTTEIDLFEFIKLYSAIFDYKVELYEQKIILYEFHLAQRNFQAIPSYILGIDK